MDLGSSWKNHYIVNFESILYLIFCPKINTSLIPWFPLIAWFFKWWDAIFFRLFSSASNLELFVSTSLYLFLVGIVLSAAYKKWEKAAIAGVSLVADAAEHLERTATDKEGENDHHVPGELVIN